MTDLFDMIALDLIREGHRKNGRRPDVARIARAIGVGLTSVRKRLKAMEAAEIIVRRPKTAPKEKPSAESTARYMAGKIRRAEVKKRAAHEKRPKSREETPKEGNGIATACQPCSENGTRAQGLNR